MSKGDSDVGTGLVGAPACGDVMKLQIRVDPTNNTISDVKFKTFGCGSAIASSSYLTELVRGMTLEDAGKIRNTEIAQELCLPPVKRMSSRLPSRIFHFLFILLAREEGEWVTLANQKFPQTPQSTVPCSPKTPSSPPSQTTTLRTPKLLQPISPALHLPSPKLKSSLRPRRHRQLLRRREQDAA